LRVRPWQAAVATVAIGVLWVLAQSQIAALHSGRPLQREFMAFYTVGYILNRFPDQLYDPDSFNRTYHALFPTVPANVRQLYGHAPFEALVFRPFALFPFEGALVAWQMLSLLLISSGFILVWRSSDGPWHQLPLPLLLALSFQPVAVACIARGQVSSLTFFWMLVLTLPMLIVGWRRRALIGFTAGAAVLGVASLAVVGWRGCADYAAVVLRFGGLATTGGNSLLLSEYVDINSFLRVATGGTDHLALGGLALMGAAIVPWLAKVWRDARPGDPLTQGLAWASTLTWTTVLNLYVPAYDTLIILLGIVLTANGLHRVNREAVPMALRILLVLLYVAPWVPLLPIGYGTMSWQPYTPVLLALGAYQLRLTRGRTGAS
jgi:hypothetical protein